MSEKDREYINLNNLSLRELMILLSRDVKELKENFEQLDREFTKQALKVNTLETKNMVWAGVVGVMVSVFVLLLEKAIGL